MSVYRRCECGKYESWGLAEAPPTLKCRACGTIPTEVGAPKAPAPSKPAAVKRKAGS